VTAWEQKTAAEIADDTRAALALTDRVVFVGTPEGFVQLRGMIHSWREAHPEIPAFWTLHPYTEDHNDPTLRRLNCLNLRVDPVATLQNTPPVIAHAPPARRGRWGRG